MAERVELPCPLCFLLPGLLLLGTLGLNAPCGVTYGEAAERVGLGADRGGSFAGIVGGAVRVDRAHAELGAAGLLGPELADQQRPALTLVPLPKCRALTPYACARMARRSHRACSLVYGLRR
ncbi:MAG: hypothetical protein ACTHZM_02935 [Canibacter sp.]